MKKCVVLFCITICFIISGCGDSQIVYPKRAPVTTRVYWQGTTQAELTDSRVVNFFFFIKKEGTVGSTTTEVTLESGQVIQDCITGNACSVYLKLNNVSFGNHAIAEVEKLLDIKPNGYLDITITKLDGVDQYSIDILSSDS